MKVIILVGSKGYYERMLKLNLTYNVANPNVLRGLILDESSPHYL